MRFTVKTAAIIGLASLSFSVSAGEYFCHGFGDAGCSEHITNVVTEKFTAKFPAKKYKIVVIYDFHTYSDGGGVGFAAAGVAPRLEGKYSDRSLVPKWRFIATTRIDNTRKLSPYDKTNEKIELIQRAVQNLMEDCERSPSCDILK